MADQYDKEAAEICAAIGFNVGRGTIAAALRKAAKDGARGWMETAAQHLRNEQYYAGLIDSAARIIGAPMFIQDDGGVVTEPLRAKLPQCVNGLNQALEDAEDMISKASRIVSRFADPDSGDPKWGDMQDLIAVIGTTNHA